MNRMVKKLLTLNQLEFGNDQVVMERFNITELIRGITGASRILLEQNGITLDLDRPGRCGCLGRRVQGGRGDHQLSEQRHQPL